MDIVTKAKVFCIAAHEAVEQAFLTGFTTEQAYINAGKKIMIPGNGAFHKTAATFTCVKMDV